MRNKGITLIALVITVIVLLILAGISISMLSGDNSILSKAGDAREETRGATVKEEIDLWNFTNLTDNFSKTTTETKNAFLDRLENQNLITSEEKTKLASGETIVIGNKQIALKDEEKVDASSLVEGDLINYYYDVTKLPIPCVVLYNDNEHGLQVVSIDSVREVILGYGEEGQDPKAVEEFAKGTPTGYGTSEFEKSRWSYNHAIQTLNGYAKDYLGEISLSARCVGSLTGNVIYEEDETTDMYEADSSYTYFEDYNGKLKNGDNNVNFDRDNNSNEDIRKMNSLGIIKAEKDYFIASRKVSSLSSLSQFSIRYIPSTGGNIFSFNLCSVSSGHNEPVWTDSIKKGIRLIFNLKKDIKIEKIGHQDYGIGGFRSGDDFLG